MTCKKNSTLGNLVVCLSAAFLVTACGGSSNDSIAEANSSANIATSVNIAPAVTTPAPTPTPTPVPSTPSIQASSVVDVQSAAVITPSTQETQNEQSIQPAQSSQPTVEEVQVEQADQQAEENTQVEQSAKATVRILPLGDSITHGGEGHPSYRRALWFMLRNGGYDIDFVGSHKGFEGHVDEYLKDFDMDHEGHWAWEAGTLEEHLAGWLNDYTPDIVLLHAGTNDVDRGQSHNSTMSELGNIIDRLRDKNPNVVVLVAKIIPMRSVDTADFNEFIEHFVASKNTSLSPVTVVDHYTDYYPWDDNHDNYHPNATGEEKMATRWFNALEPYLN